MNKRQKNVLLSFTLFSSLILLVWYFISGKVFTASQVLVESKDELFGWTEKKWIDKFVPGLDLAAAVIIILLIISLYLIYRYRTPGKD